MRKYKYNKEDLEEAVLQSSTYVEVFRILGLCPTNYKHLKKKIKEYNINISHFNQKNSKLGKVKRTLNEIMVEDYRGPLNTTNLKEKLYNNKLKDRKCELCNQSEIWNNKKLSLILDHINGNRYDNRLENLRILCPNCNATLSTHCGKNKKKTNIIFSSDNTIKEKSLSEIKLEKQIELIKNSNIDFTQWGWGIKLAKLIGIHSQRTGKFLKKHMPEIWDICRKNKK